MNNDNTQDDRKHRLLLALFGLLVIALAILCSMYASGKISLPSTGGIKMQSDFGQKKPAQKVDAGQIQIPGYAEIAMRAGDKTVYVDLTNPETNQCNFRYTIKLKETGEVLYQSDYLAPGQTIHSIELQQALNAGNYTALVEVRTVSLDETHTPLNGANMETTLVVV
jgi:hypothetical protein